ncbi:MAG TPA: hypothetical protein VH597_14830 [Verrucomicrobiae bacterium]|jgi:hypothetical protein|nr:hypothetical protein [Verrucomicrobiae bacterium]
MELGQAIIAQNKTMQIQSGEKFTVFEILIGKDFHKKIGIKHDGAMSVIISSISRASTTEEHESELTLELGAVERTGNGSRQFLKWASEALSVGQEVVVRINCASHCDPPESIRVEEPRQVIEQKKRYLQNLKDEIEENDNKK